MDQMNHEGETSITWAKLKARLQHLLTIPERAAQAMAAEELRARAAHEQEQGQAKHDYGLEEP